MRASRVAKLRALALALLWLGGGAGSPSAVDGVIEINQARALAGSVTAGDTAGFPMTISTRGSYRLTGDLVVPDANTTAVEISAADVTVDLNGYSIQGVTSCTGVPAECTNTGTGKGIDSYTQAAENTTVENGTVRGMGNYGLYLYDGGRAIHVRALGHGISGNTAYALNLSGGFGADGYAQNLLTDNDGGNSNPQVSGGVEIGTNVCGTNTTCP